MDCVGHKTRSGLVNMPSPQWFLPNGTLLSSIGDVQLQGPRNVRLLSEIVALFPTLRTSHAGTYTCQASLSSPALTSPIVKAATFEITVQSKSSNIHRYLEMTIANTLKHVKHYYNKPCPNISCILAYELNYMQRGLLRKKNVQSHVR